MKLEDGEGESNSLILPPSFLVFMQVFLFSFAQFTELYLKFESDSTVILTYLSPFSGFLASNNIIIPFFFHGENNLSVPRIIPINDLC